MFRCLESDAKAVFGYSFIFSQQFMTNILEKDKNQSGNLIRETCPTVPNTFYKLTLLTTCHYGYNTSEPVLSTRLTTRKNLKTGCPFLYLPHRRDSRQRRDRPLTRPLILRRKTVRRVRVRSLVKRKRENRRVSWILEVYQNRGGLGSIVCGFDRWDWLLLLLRVVADCHLSNGQIKIIEYIFILFRKISKQQQ